MRNKITLLTLAILLALAAILSLSGDAAATSHFKDYDTDNDGYIEISNHQQLDAIRYDLDGQGDAIDPKYATAFPDRNTASNARMGCPSGTCVGYELNQNIDLDTSGSGGNTYTTGDAYYNGGSGWDPIGEYTGDFKGNGYEIQNLYINRIGSNDSDIGLFSSLTNAVTIESLGVTNANVTGRYRVGIIAGDSDADITACWTTGSVRATLHTSGGLAGRVQDGTIHSSYSHASVGQGGVDFAGGLVGTLNFSSAIRNSYATGRVSGANWIGGITGQATSTSATHHNTYWNTSTSGRSNGLTSVGSAPTTGVTGRTTAQLQNPTDYIGIYAAWNANIDGAAGNDDPWRFDSAADYPRLIFGGPEIDYDADNDNYIEVFGHAQLDAIRLDLDGNGSVAAGAARTAYNAAFSNAASGMGCASTCVGYELTANINLDTNLSGGSTWTSADAYYNAGGAGTGWSPIGAAASAYSGDFKGNGFEVQNLFISRSAALNQGLFGINTAASRIETLGVTNGNVTGGNSTGILIGANYGAVVASYSTGAVSGGQYVGGLAGYMHTGGYIHSSYSRASVGGTTVRRGGLVGLMYSNSHVYNSYSTGRVNGSGSNIGGLVGSRWNNTATASNSFWDTQTSNQSGSVVGTGKTTTQLQSPTDYTDPYENWNANLDTGGIDDPWDFGSTSAYPTLVYHLTDYDRDEDGYIEISTHQQLNAIRHDLNGNGDATHADYIAAFPNRRTSATKRMGCPAGTCTGYELTANIDLDTSGSGGSAWTAADAYYNGNSGWLPITVYTSNFKGNGYTIDNLYINRNSSTVGLFGDVQSGRIEFLGVTNASVMGDANTGILTGINRGAIVGCYTTGSVTGGDQTGGLVGWATSAASHHSSYSTASVTGGQYVGGMIGYAIHGSVTNSYSTGSVSGSSNVGGFIGWVNGANATHSDNYWNTQTSSRSNGLGGTSHTANNTGITGKTTAQLQAPIYYTGIYANWNANIDGAAGNDIPWRFGTSSDYPTLAAFDKTFVDYDTDNDNYIEVADHFQLNAVRYDLNGNGAQGSVSSDDWSHHRYAFHNAVHNMGCAGACTGYELSASIDFDSDADGDVDANDNGGLYHNSGAGWQPIGPSNTSAYSGDFKGNGYTIDNLYINRTSSSDDYMSLFGYTAATARIETLGVTNANVTGEDYVGILAGVNLGDIVACYTTGKAQGEDYIGGLVGFHSGSISTSYSTAYVSGNTNVGGLIAYESGSGSSTTNSYSTGRVNRASGMATTIGGLMGGAAADASVTNSYWDTVSSGQATSAGGSGVVGKTPRQLQTVTSYTGIYANWNANLDGQSGNDDPWAFGNGMQYPMLDYQSMSTTPQGGLAMGIPDNWNAPIVGELVGVCLMTPSTRATNTGGTGKKAWIWERSDNGDVWETAGGTITGPTYEYSPVAADANHFLRAKVELAAGGFAYTRMLGGRVKSASGAATGTDSIILRYGHTSPVVGTEIEGSAPPTGAVDARVGWQRCPNTAAPHTDCVAILDVDWRRYTPVAADVGNYLRMYIYYQTSGGTWTRIETGFSGQVAASQ